MIKLIIKFVSGKIFVVMVQLVHTLTSIYRLVTSDSEEERQKKILAQKRREAERQKPSPGSVAIHSNRLSFFDNPTEPVRIDPWSFLGLPSKAPAAQSNPKDEVSNEEQEEEVDAERKVNISLLSAFTKTIPFQTCNMVSVLRGIHYFTSLQNTRGTYETRKDIEI